MTLTFFNGVNGFSIFPILIISSSHIIFSAKFGTLVQIILFHFSYHLSRFIWQDEDGVGWVGNIKGKGA